VSIAHLYFDESGSHAGSRLMSVAGYWFDQQQAARFTRDWAKDLSGFGLSHAHMTDCALGFGEYKNLSLRQRVQVQTLLIQHIKRRSRFGFGVCISPKMYDEIMAGIPGAPSCYSLCLMLCVNKIGEFARVTHYPGKLSYFFESGHQSAKEADRFVKALDTIGSADYHRYAGHAFLDKDEALPLQAADMFAWHLRHYYDRALDGHVEPRRDYRALARKFDYQTLVTKRHLLALREAFVRLPPILQSKEPALAVQVGGQILSAFGLEEEPVWIPKHSFRSTRGMPAEKPVVRH
jgi:hypothetical protein